MSLGDFLKAFLNWYIMNDIKIYLTKITKQVTFIKQEGIFMLYEFLKENYQEG